MPLSHERSLEERIVLSNCLRAVKEVMQAACPSTRAYLYTHIASADILVLITSSESYNSHFTHKNL
jgi:hypothetical protein